MEIHQEKETLIDLLALPPSGFGALKDRDIVRVCVYLLYLQGTWTVM